jgi:hydrogenase maturation protein HypF
MQASLPSLEGRRIRIRGTVQGVGFRPWIYRIAHELGLTGSVRNDSAGVTIEAFGGREALARFLNALEFPPPAARILTVDLSPIDVEPASEFAIVPSVDTAERRASIPADLATCDACVGDIFDPANRRFRYPFTTCTNCGPRFTIASDIPYDRGTTTMAPFTMCPECRREYEDPLDRRFHAEPIACPVCGPSATLHTSEGEFIGVVDAVASAAAALRHGLIVAIKGLGGFHLACDATDASAVGTLRARKRRDEKPFAIMAAGLEMAEDLAILGAEERRLLTSVERPIVLAPKRPSSPVADNVAPGNTLIGIMLPYSPLHHLLLADAARPLVMTSGNLSEEPIAFRNVDAIERLGSIADLFVLHDREIQTRCDDSVGAIVGGGPMLFRRSRGYVPAAIQIAPAFDWPVLACGALLKNTFCLASGSQAWLGPHIGDLENIATYDSYTEAIDRLQRFLQIKPEVIAYDLHPDYLSSGYARTRAAGFKVGVQHHHAHIVSVMAEHGVEGPVIGLAYDGTGYGPDRTSWGGEIFVAELTRYTRVGTFRPIALAGGDRAIREPWRIGLALLLDAYGGELPRAAAALLEIVPPAERTAVAQLLRARVQTPMAHGAGRYFDAFGSLFLGRTRASFEGQVALEWNQVASGVEAPAYPFDIDLSVEPWQVNFRPMVRAAVDDFARGRDPGEISAAFHATLAEASAAAVRRVAATYGRLPVAASGGCFQNARLAEAIAAALAPEYEVLFNRQVPPGDGGIALGQAVIANAVIRWR